MGLLQTWGEQNNQTNTGLQIRYRVSPSTMLSAGYEYVRYASKSYEFVGMDYATAKRCQESKLAQYTRQYSSIKLVTETDLSTTTERVEPVLVTECKSDIVLQHMDGGMYNVIINVQEEDVKYSETQVSPASLFASENSRNYDDDNGGGQGIEIQSVSHNMDVITISIKVNGIPNFQYGNCLIKWKDASATQENTELNYASDRVVFTHVPYSDVKSVQVCYGDIQSPYFATDF